MYIKTECRLLDILICKLCKMVRYPGILLNIILHFRLFSICPCKPEDPRSLHGLVARAGRGDGESSAVTINLLLLPPNPSWVITREAPHRSVNPMEFSLYLWPIIAVAVFSRNRENLSLNSLLKRNQHLLSKRH